MSDPHPSPIRLSPARLIAAKDMSDAARDRFILAITGFLAFAALVSLVAGAIALATDAATYDSARAALLALGKPAESIAAPEFYPLKLLRGAIEQIEIIGAAIAILIGYRAAISERGRQTLALILTRPVHKRAFLAGKVMAGVLLIGLGLGAVFFVSALALQVVSGVGLVPADLGRIGLVWGAASLYCAAFFLVSFMLTFWMNRPAHALLFAFSLWLVLVLIAPQIGDTLDPDNQVAGGVFRQLHIAKADQTEIMKGYASFETIRNGIEVASLTKHFERFSFAVLGIKDTYTGQPLGPILVEKLGDLLWILLAFTGLAGLALALPLSPARHIAARQIPARQIKE